MTALSLGFWFLALLLYGFTYVLACVSWRKLGLAKLGVALAWPIAAGILSTYVSAYSTDNELRVSNEYFRALGIPLLIILQFFLFILKYISATSSAGAEGTPSDPPAWKQIGRLGAALGGCVLFPLFFVTNCVVLTVDWQQDPSAEMLAEVTTSRINKGLGEAERWEVEIVKIEFGRKPADYRRRILYNTLHGGGQIVYNMSTVYARGRRGNEVRYWRLWIGPEGLVPYFRAAENEQALAGRWLASEYDAGQVPMY